MSHHPKKQVLMLSKIDNRNSTTRKAAESTCKDAKCTDAWLKKISSFYDRRISQPP